MNLNISKLELKERYLKYDRGMAKIRRKLNGIYWILNEFKLMNIIRNYLVHIMKSRQTWWLTSEVPAIGWLRQGSSGV